ncbi:hypothetical protein [Chryseobacterium sp. SIMBA_029]
MITKLENLNFISDIDNLRGPHQRDKIICQIEDWKIFDETGKVELLAIIK